jgi:hypothetical protein
MGTIKMNQGPEQFIEEMRQKAKRFAAAKADRVRLEHFRKSKQAMLMKEAEKAGFHTAAAQEREALADPAYTELLDGLHMATLEEETLRWELEAARYRLDVWRTRMASARQEKAAYGA